MRQIRYRNWHLFVDNATGRRLARACVPARDINALHDRTAIRRLDLQDFSLLSLVFTGDHLNTIAFSEISQPSSYPILIRAR